MFILYEEARQKLFDRYSAHTIEYGNPHERIIGTNVVTAILHLQPEFDSLWVVGIIAAGTL